LKPGGETSGVNRDEALTQIGFFAGITPLTYVGPVGAAPQHSAKDLHQHPQSVPFIPRMELGPSQRHQTFGVVGDRRVRCDVAFRVLRPPFGDWLVFSFLNLDLKKKWISLKVQRQGGWYLSDGDGRGRHVQHETVAAARRRPERYGVGSQS
jgi:hypothetical protein